MMTSFNRPLAAAVAPVSAQKRMMRKPQRLCTTVSWEVARRLQERADLDGRSLSNLIAHLLEVSCP